MQFLMGFFAGLFLIIYFIKYEQNILRTRIEILFALAGIDYKPSKNVCFFVGALMFWAIYGVIFVR